MTWLRRSDFGHVGGYRGWRHFPWIDVGSQTWHDGQRLGYRRVLMIWTPLGELAVPFGRVLDHWPTPWRRDYPWERT